MAIQVVRYQQGGAPKWGVHKDGKVAPLSGDWPTTEAFLTSGGQEAAAQAGAGTLDYDTLTILSPITRDGDYICCGMNYKSHVLDIGRKVEDCVHNVMFTKASSCICGANDDVIKPAHVKALDYEIELGLVMTKYVTGPEDVTADNLHDYVGALVATNDVSARGVQIGCAQFHKGKSYRTFGPTGPFLVLVSKEELERWGELELDLSVDGQQRQKMPCSDMIHDPIKTVREMTEIRDLKPGDFIATGSCVGTAIKAPPPEILKNFGKMTDAQRGQAFVDIADGNPKYLRHGNVITATIKTPDGSIDLGVQRNTIVDA